MTTAVNAATPYSPPRAARSAQWLRIFERTVVFLLAVSLPLENELPAIFGRSIPALILMIVGVYAVLLHPKRLFRTAMHPFFALAFLFVALAMLMEYGHEDPDTTFAVRVFQMFLGTMILATFCRDRETLNYGLAGILVSGFLLSVAIVSGSYGKISARQVASFQEASKLRGDVFIGTALDMGLNRMSYLCGEASVVGLALMFQAKNSKFRMVMLGFTLVCLLGMFLMFSRGGALISAVGGLVVFFLYRGKNLHRLLFAGLIALALSVVVPDAVFQRLQYGPQRYQSGRVESRTLLYSAALNAMPKYAVLGVGAGPFWSHWAVENGMEKDGSPIPAHNTFLQVWIFWGLPALIAFVFMLSTLVRSLPWVFRGDSIALCLFGVAACEAVRMQVSHTFYDKSLAIAFGLIIGSKLYVWSKGPQTPTQDAAPKPAVS